MEKLTYVTGNHGKYLSVRQKFKSANIELDFFIHEFIEAPINDIKYISKQKAQEAYQILKTPIFVSDTGFYIEQYPNNPLYPGAFVKRSLIASNIEGLLKTMEEVNNRKCYFIDCITFYDGEEYYQFIGRIDGTLSREKRGNNIKRAQSNLWYVFIPESKDKTLAQMNDDEINERINNQKTSTSKFLNWYQESYLNIKKLSKKKAP